MASRLFPGVCLALLTAACGSAPAPEQGKGGATESTSPLRLQPGRWQQTLLNGAPSPATETRCISPDEAQSANGTDAEIRGALQAQAHKDGCTLGTVTINGPTIAYEQTCSGALLHITTTYHGTSSTFEMTGGGLPKMSTESRRVGDCG